jgi:predicted nucleic acid-binding protein
LKYLLDTNIISELINITPNKNVISLISTLNEDEIYLSAITIGEISFGIEKLKSTQKKKELQKWLNTDLLKRFKNKIIDVDTEIMILWGSLNNTLKITGRPMPVMDSLIGATCQAKNFVLITRNEKDFINLDIEIINPFK